MPFPFDPATGVGFNDFTNAHAEQADAAPAERQRAGRRVRDPVGGELPALLLELHGGAEQGFDREIIFTNEEATDFVNRTGEAWPARAGAEQAGVVVAYDVASGEYKTDLRDGPAQPREQRRRSPATAIRSCSRATTRSRLRRRSSTSIRRRRARSCGPTRGRCTRSGRATRRSTTTAICPEHEPPCGHVHPGAARRSRRATRRRSRTGRTRTTSSSSSASRTSPTTARRRTSSTSRTPASPGRCRTRRPAG